jgi:hypothetical protein
VPTTGASSWTTASIIASARSRSSRSRLRVPPRARTVFPGLRSPVSRCSAGPRDVGSLSQSCQFALPGVDLRATALLRQRRDCSAIPLLAPLADERRVQALAPQQRALAGFIQPVVLGENPQLVGRAEPPLPGAFAHLRVGLPSERWSGDRCWVASTTPTPEQPEFGCPFAPLQPDESGRNRGRQTLVWNVLKTRCTR